MANFFGTNINVITGFEVSDGKPIDPRYVVEKNTDLDSAIAFKYAGLITFVKEDGKFHYYNGCLQPVLRVRRVTRVPYGIRLPVVMLVTMLLKEQDRMITFWTLVTGMYSSLTLVRS